MTKEKFRIWLKQLLEEKNSPHEIALGFALGLLIGILPVRNIGIPLCVLLILLIRKINKLATFIGLALISLTMPFLFKPVLWLATNITGAKIKTSLNVFLKTDILHMIKPLLIGNLILAFSIAIISYLIVYFIFKRIKKHNDKKNKSKDRKD